MYQVRAFNKEDKIHKSGKGAGSETFCKAKELSIEKCVRGEARVRGLEFVWMRCK